MFERLFSLLVPMHLPSACEHIFFFDHAMLHKE